MPTEVAFPGAGGATLRGDLYIADGADNGPGLIMAHGFSATRDMALGRFAEVFRAAGISVLVYDHRNLGASDGEPRQEINIWAQARDYRYALSWLAQRPEVDPARIGLWGSSFSGGEVMVAAACDRRVAAVVANVPFATLGDGQSDDDDAFEAIRANLLDESGAGLADAPGESMGPFAVVREDDGELPVFLDTPDSQAWFLENGRAPGSLWRNRVTLRNCFGTQPAFDPGACIRHIAPTPLLMIVASDDHLAATDATLATFRRAGEPKQLEVLPGNHFVCYQGEGFERASALMRAFLLEHL